MAKKQRTKKTEQPDPFDFSAEFVENSFKEAVEDILVQQRRAGLDSYGAVDGKLVVVRPDGTIEPLVSNPKTSNNNKDEKPGPQ